MRTTKELIEAFFNDEKLLSYEAPVEAFAPELSEEAIEALKTFGIKTVGEFQNMSADQVYELKCDDDLVSELLDHWYDIHEE